MIDVDEEVGNDMIGGREYNWGEKSLMMMMICQDGWRWRQNTSPRLPDMRISRLKYDKRSCIRVGKKERTQDVAGV